MIRGLRSGYAMRGISSVFLIRKEKASELISDVENQTPDGST